MPRRLLPLVLAIGLTACHKHASPEPTCVNCDVVQPPALTCPAPVSKTTPSSKITSMQVDYSAPTLSGGTEPVSTSCSPAPGSTFQAGKTTVTCTATDAVQRQAACTVDVTVNVPAPPTPILVGTKFLAFGDSITLGETGGGFLPSVPLVIDTGYDYPTILQQLLVARYTTQTPVVINSGSAGEFALGGGTGRIEGVLQANGPDALLLLEGVNDLSPTEDFNVKVDNVVQALRFDIDVAKARGVKTTFLSTLTPVLPGTRDWAIHNGDLITPVNNGIRSLAAESGAVLVDAFKVLSTNAQLYIESDGLHLTREGRRTLAEAFLAAIEAKFEVSTDSAIRSRLLFRPPPPAQPVQPRRIR